jgi:preprotein translocase subunit SecG
MAGKHNVMGLKTFPQTRSAHPVCSVSNQNGFISSRTTAILAVLVVILVVPLWWSKNKKDSAKANAATQAKPTGKAQPSAQAGTPGESTAAAINPDRFGLSFGHMSVPNTPSLTVDLMHSACSGTPQDMANPDKGQCNPAQGDSSCRSALPVLCVLQDGSTAESAGLVDTKVEGGSPSYSASAGWVGGTLGATAPVAGFVLESLATANARCTKELGTSWRMAELHDGKGNAGNASLLGKRGPGLTSQQTRHWVYANDQKANCWDPILQ